MAKADKEGDFKTLPKTKKGRGRPKGSTKKKIAAKKVETTEPTVEEVKLTQIKGVKAEVKRLEETGVQPVKKGEPKIPVIAAKLTTEPEPKGVATPVLVSGSATKKLFERMVKKSQSFGLAIPLCYSSYEIGDDLTGKIHQYNEGINSYKTTEEKQQSINTFIEALGKKISRGDLLSKDGFELNDEIVKIPEDLVINYFNLKAVTSQMKKLHDLQEECDNANLSEEDIDELSKKWEKQLGKGETQTAKIKNMILTQKTAYKLAEEQLDELEKKEEKAVKAIKEVKETAEKESKLRKEAREKIERDKFFEELLIEKELLDSPELGGIQYNLKKEYKEAGEDDTKKAKAVTKAIDSISDIIPKYFQMAKHKTEKGKEFRKKAKALTPAQKDRVEKTDKFYEQLRALSGKNAAKLTVDTFFKRYIPSETVFETEVKEAIKSPHTGFSKIIDKGGALKLKKAKLESIANVTKQLRKEMKLKGVKAPAKIKAKPTSEKLKTYGSSVQEMVAKPDFNTLAIPIKTMAALIREEEVKFKAAK